MRLLFSAGGTGGHIMPLLAVADKVKSFQPEVEVLFIVGGRSIDKTIVSSIPYPVVHLPLKKGVEGVYSGLKLAFKTLFAFNLPILRLVTSSRGVVTSGSYVSLLPILCALATTRPIYLIEPNAYPGKFTRFFGRFCRKVFGGWHTLRRNLSETNLSITGVPLRSGFSKNLTAREARTVLGISEKKVVLLVLGGSQGAQALNRFIVENGKLLKYGVPDLFILHIAGGNRAAQEVRSAYERIGIPSHVFDWWDEMWTLYAASDVVVGRAGALTCAEIMRMRKPALLVPHPACADQHQLFNATELERLGAAVVVEQKNLSSKGTTSLLSLLLNSRRREKAVEVYEKNDSLRVAEEKIAEEIVREVLEDNRDGKISQVVANRRTRSFVFDCGAA